MAEGLVCHVSVVVKNMDRPGEAKTTSYQSASEFDIVPRHNGTTNCLAPMKLQQACMGISQKAERDAEKKSRIRAGLPCAPSRASDNCASRALCNTPEAESVHFSANERSLQQRAEAGSGSGALRSTDHTIGLPSVERSFARSLSSSLPDQSGYGKLDTSSMPGAQHSPAIWIGSSRFVPKTSAAARRIGQASLTQWVQIGQQSKDFYRRGKQQERHPALSKCQLSRNQSYC